MSTKEELAAAARRRHLEERDAAVTIGSFEMITKGVLGAVAGYGGVQLMNRLHAGFAAIPTAPVKVALITMCAIAAGGLSSEQKVSLHARKMLDGQDHADSNGRLFEESSTLRDAFHEHKFKAVGLLWAGSIAFSLRGGKTAMPLYQRMIDARIFAQWMTVGSAMALMILTTVFPDDRNVNRYHLEHAPTSIHKQAASPSSPTAKLIAEAVAASAELQEAVAEPAVAASTRTITPKTL